MRYNKAMGNNLSFEEQRTQYSSYTGPKGMVGFLVKKCGVRDESVANLILIGIAVVIFALAGLVFYQALK
jgi:hypothetical protein